MELLVAVNSNNLTQKIHSKPASRNDPRGNYFFEKILKNFEKRLDIYTQCVYNISKEREINLNNSRRSPP